VTGDERRQALEAIAEEISVCTRCRLHEGRTRAVPGEGDADTEVVFVGEGPGFNEDREGRPFVGRAGGLLVQLLASIGWRREDVYITNVVKCRPPGNRDPQPDEIAACAPYLQRQLTVLDPAVVVTLGRYSMATFMPGVRIGQVHGTSQPIDPATGARDALAFAMYHPAAALRTAAVERESYEDIARVPEVLVRARRRRQASAAANAGDVGDSAAAAGTTGPAPDAERAASDTSTGNASAGDIEPHATSDQAGTPSSSTTSAISAGDQPDNDPQLTLFQT
jgi:uracil-DNA glycosylase family 4